MNPYLLELVRLLAATAQLQMVAAPTDRTHAVKLTPPGDDGPRQELIREASTCTERQGPLAQLQMRVPREYDAQGLSTIGQAGVYTDLLFGIQPTHKERSKRLVKSRRGAVF